MKSLNNYINERLKISNETNPDHNYFPQTKDELLDILEKLLEERGCDADLNDIDVSQITNMNALFHPIKLKATKIRNIDISQWDVSNVTDMSWMFTDREHFNADLSQWNVSRVNNMSGMFENCFKFNSDLSLWDVSNCKMMNRMFFFCKRFNSNLSNWKVNTNCKLYSMFTGCKVKEPKWYKKSNFK